MPDDPPVPDFLVIGAMKSGTTSMYEDLRRVPGLFLAEKELNLLADPGLDAAEAAVRYAEQFRAAGDHQLRGEVSTDYAKRPEILGVAERARALLPEETKIIYLVREPISRALSHHYHGLVAGEIEESDPDAALRRVPQLLDFGRYAMQLEPWIEIFGRERILVVRFESYIAARGDTMAEVCRFLGCEPLLDELRVDEAFNASGSARAQRGLFWWFSQSRFYRGWLRPHLGSRLRWTLGRLALPKAPPRPGPPSSETVEWMLDELHSDLEELARIAALGAPLWDLDAVRRKYRGP